MIYWLTDGFNGADLRNVCTETGEFSAFSQVLFQFCGFWELYNYNPSAQTTVKKFHTLFLLIIWMEILQIEWVLFFKISC